MVCHLMRLLPLGTQVKLYPKAGEFRQFHMQLVIGGPETPNQIR